MIDPFVSPDEPSAADAIAAIGEELDVFDDWMERYQFIMELGRKLPPFPEAWSDDAHRVPGCQSRVWMEGALRDGRLFLAGTSDAAIVAGLIALLLRVYSGRSPSGDRRHRPGLPEGPRPAGGIVHQPRQRHCRDGAQDPRTRRIAARRVTGNVGRRPRRAVLRGAVFRRRHQHCLPAAVVRRSRAERRRDRPGAGRGRVAAGDRRPELGHGCRPDRPPAGDAGGLGHRDRGGAALRPVARVPAAAAGRRRAGRRLVRAQPADQFAGARPRAGRAHGIRQGALDRLDRLHGGERGSGLAAVRRRLLAGALAAGRELRRRRGRDAAAAGDRRPDRACAAPWPGCTCSQSARSA